MTTLLIDGDVLCYRAGFATDKTKYLIMTPVRTDGGAPDVVFDDAKSAKEVSAKCEGSLIWSRREAEPEDKALMLVSVMLKDIEDHYAAENPTSVVYLSGVGNFRHGVATRASYKGNRSGSPQPTHMRAIREYLKSRGASCLCRRRGRRPYRYCNDGGYVCCVLQH